MGEGVDDAWLLSGYRIVLQKDVTLKLGVHLDTPI